jgi:hypothetical protein
MHQRCPRDCHHHPPHGGIEPWVEEPWVAGTGFGLGLDCIALLDGLGLVGCGLDWIALLDGLGLVGCGCGLVGCGLVGCGLELQI